MDRGLFLAGSGATLALPRRLAAATPEIRAIAFDAFPIFDPSSITALGVAIALNAGAALVYTTRVLDAYEALESA